MEIDMDGMITQFDWSKVFLNDSRELAKKQTRTSGYSRRLFSKMKRTSTPAKHRARSSIYHKYLARSKRTSSGKTNSTKNFTKRIGNDQKPENDMWNMIQQAIQQSLQSKFQIETSNNCDIAVLNSNDNIRLIQNRQELNEQILVSSNGMKTRVKDFANPNDYTENMLYKVQYRLVPVIESLAVVNNSIETTYKFVENAKDINNNGNETHMVLNEHFDRTEISTDNTYPNTTYEDDDDKTITNTSELSWEYSDFQNDISPEVASTFISEEKENIPFMTAPRK